MRAALGVLAAGLLYTLARELTKIPAKLMVLMATAFLDMVGLLIVVPILPFYARRLGGEGFTLGSVHFGIGSVVALLASAFNGAQLVSAPLWGRFSDRYGRRPALMWRSARRPPRTSCSGSPTRCGCCSVAAGAGRRRRNRRRDPGVRGRQGGARGTGAGAGLAVGGHQPGRGARSRAGRSIS